MTEPEVIDPVKQLRAALKEWEKAFASVNGGRKASRDDIKKEPEIAAKYKEYNRLTGRVGPPAITGTGTVDQPRPLKHRREDTENEGGNRARPLHASDIDPYDAPLQRTPSAVRTFVGPTPQKNGQILGLFDMLSPAKDGTPSRKNSSSFHSNVAAFTPSRTRVSDTRLLPAFTPPKSQGTPSRRAPQDKRQNYTTPSAQRIRAKPTPGSSKSKHDETPAFLRRQSSKLVEPPKEPDSGVEESLSFSPVAVRLPPRPAGKGLSALIQGLRHMEEDRLDEELDLLREVEAEESGGLALPKKPIVLVEDSQILEAAELPLGADGEGPESDEDELAPTRDERNLRPWKKRGQKRTTRRANMAPRTAKLKPEPGWMVGDNMGREIEGINDRSKLGKETNSKGKAVEERASRKKISATAHANFRALKIRNKHSKGKGAGFRGRRR